MAVPRRDSIVDRLTSLLHRRENGPDHRRRERLEEKRRALAAATEQWVTLLREMERDGETGDSRYESYYQAYLQARQQENRADLELFNLRQGLSG
jgi:hypothetical protein